MGDDAGQRDAVEDAQLRLPVDGPTGEPASALQWPDYQGGSPPEWPAYDADAGRLDGIDDNPVAVPPQRERGRLAPLAVPVGMLLAAGAILALAPPTSPVATRPEPAAAKPVAPIAPVKPAGPQWAPVDSSLTAGLVRVQVTPTVEADGIVLSDEGLVATSYARLVGFNTAAAYIEAIELDVIADGGLPMRAELIAFDATRDVAVLRVPGYTPASIARPGAPVEIGDRLTLLDDQGDGQPVVGYPVTVGATEQPCFRTAAAMISRPEGFEFSLELRTAEPGAAVVRDDGTVVGMYYGGDDGPHCAVPIAEVAEVVRTVERGEQTATTRIGLAGGLGVQLYGPDDTYPQVTGIDGLADPGLGVDLQLGDVLTRVGDTSLHRDDLTTLGPEGVIRMLTPGEKVTVEWESDGVPHRAVGRVGVGAQPHG